MVEAEVGAMLSAGTTVVRLARDGPRDAVFAVPEDGAPALRALQGKPGALQVRGWNSTTLLPATVREVAAAADPATRTFLVKADVGAAPVQLGQTVTVVVDGPCREGVTKLPLTAVMRQQGQTAVWLLDRTRITDKVQLIVMSGAEGNAVMVASGLAPGQTVVTAGVHTLMPGQKVKLYEAPGPMAAGSRQPLKGARAMTTPVDTIAGLRLNVTRWALEHPALTRYLMVVTLLLGTAAYLQLGQDEDPPVTFRVMVMQAFWPGASAQQMAEQVTGMIERTLQKVPHSERIRSCTKPGESLKILQLKDSAPPKEVAGSCYQVRKDVADMRSTLPQGVIGPVFNDDFGDVGGSIFALSADGFSGEELRVFADRVR